jgi:hypothetical protein
MYCQTDSNNDNGTLEQLGEPNFYITILLIYYCNFLGTTNTLEGE